MLKNFLSPLFTLLIAVSAWGQSNFSVPETMNDAELTSVFFVDVDYGWAVGDRGAIWHTVDGGRNWQRQDSPVACRFESVHFLDPQRGWIVGGRHEPYTHRSVGVVLYTQNGGKTWQNVKGLALPALRYIEFFDADRGRAVGESSPMFPSGVFTTDDGGRGWSSLPTPRRGQWAAADFFDARTAIVASQENQAAVVKGQELRPAFSNGGERPVRAVKFVNAKSAWMCGAGGLLLHSSDGGSQWQAPPGAPPAERLRSFDFQALASSGTHVWCVGSPGSQVFHSPNAGRTWESHRTEISTPLHGLFFLDENRGWAVGSLGTILATTDGGRSWRVQRQGGKRAALLGLFSRPERVPYEALVQIAGNDGYLAAVDIVCRNDDRSMFVQESLARESLLRTGATATSLAPDFPLPPSETHGTLQRMVEHWRTTENADPLRALEERFVAKIRTWRPEVILTEDASPSGANPTAHLMNQLVLSAVEKAANSKAFPHQIERDGLAAWRVKKVFAANEGDRTGAINLVCTQLAPRLGASLSESASIARSYWHDDVQLGRASQGFSLVLDGLPQGQGRRDFFSGVPLAAGSEARRMPSTAPATDLPTLTKRIQKRQGLLTLLTRAESQPMRGTVWLAEAEEFTRGLPDEFIAQTWFLLGKRYEESDDADLADRVYSQLVQRYPEHPLSDLARLRMLALFSSGEAAWHEHRRPHTTETVVAATSTDKVVRASATVMRIANLDSSAGTEADRFAKARFDRALQIGREIEKANPFLHAEPSVRYAVASTTLRQGSGEAADKLLQSTAASGAESWSEAAKLELNLRQQRDALPLSTLVCGNATVKPRLDGRLDDAMWRGASVVSLGTKPEYDRSPADVVFACDEEFLYFAASCRRAEGASYPVDDQPRAHDENLSRRDRMEIRLDVDRDYATYYHLAVDYRGRTWEAINDNAGWNPQWFVAHGGDASQWTIEAAVPWSELAARPPTEKSLWTVGIERIVPNVGRQSLQTLASGASPPASWSLLKFDRPGVEIPQDSNRKSAIEPPPRLP